VHQNPEGTDWASLAVVMCMNLVEPTNLSSFVGSTFLFSSWACKIFDGEKYAQRQCGFSHELTVTVWPSRFCLLLFDIMSCCVRQTTKMGMIKTSKHFLIKARTIFQKMWQSCSTKTGDNKQHK
jgi:hypothetical protein